mgnify:CR=1 FL=1
MRRVAGFVFAGGLTTLLLAAAIVVINGFFPALWILLTSLKQPLDVIAAPPKLIFDPATQHFSIQVGETTVYEVTP